MKISSDQGAEVLGLNLPVDALEKSGGVTIRYPDDGEVVHVEFLDASQRGLVDGASLSVALEP